MKLTDLNPSFLGAGGEGITRNGEPVPRREGVMLWCDCPCGTPECAIAVHFANPLDGGPPISDHHWMREGDTFETLTLRPSIFKNPAKGGCGWHGFLTNGEMVSV